MEEVILKEFCAIPTDICRTMAEWGVYWQALGTVVAAIIGICGLYKIYHELSELNRKKQKDVEDQNSASALKRTEFFLTQHRRLFDDPILYEILSMLDGDDATLADENYWDKKRKLLTFFEEIALLVRSKHIDENVAFYMFGYYMKKARHGENFNVGIHQASSNWGLFYEFSVKAEEFLDKNPNGPPTDLKL